MQGIDGLVDLSVEQQTDIPTVRVNFDRGALGRYGLQSGAAAEALETALVGREVGQILEGQIAVPLVIRYPQADSAGSGGHSRHTAAHVDAAGACRSSAVADVREDRSPNFISRENVQRKITVTANVAGRDLGSVVERCADRRRGRASSCRRATGSSTAASSRAASRRPRCCCG